MGKVGQASLCANRASRISPHLKADRVFKLVAKVKSVTSGMAVVKVDI